jgi:hypothetical protein
MGTGFSMDPNEYHAAANVIEGYGSQQADNGAALAAGTSTPLSSSGTGIAGAISQIAQGTVQKIVTDVTSTTQGFANDTAKGLRTQASNMTQLESDLASRSNAILNGTQSSLLGGMSAISNMSAMASSPLSSYSASGMTGMTSMGSPMTTSAPQDESSLGEGAQTESGVSESGLTEAGAGAAAAGQEEAQQEAAMPFGGGMRGGAGAAAGAAEERGQRPDYLKSKTEVGGKSGDPVQAAIDKHLKECGAAPIPLGDNQLVCAKCGSILTVENPQALAEES